MSKLNTRIRQLELDAEQQAAVDHALGAPGTRLVGHRSAAGDPRRLRGIPVCGGCAGAMPGTRPDSAVR